jgi:hypothetical protein
VPESKDVSLLPKIQNLDHYRYCEANLDILLETYVFETLKERFMENKKDPYDPKYFNVVVHIRRPNQHDNRLMGADTPDSYYLSVMDTIRKEHDCEKQIKFHIYSQGDISLFEVYKGDDVEFHLDTSAEDALTGLLFGDILVTSASSLSYIAAIYTNAKIYYKSFWHPPSKSWRKMETKTTYY